VNVAMASGEDKFLLDAMDGNASLSVDGTLSAATGGDDDIIRVQARDGSSSVTIGGEALLDVGNSFDTAGDLISIRAMTGSAAVTFQADTTLRSNDSRRGENMTTLRADADNARLHFMRTLTIELGNHNNPSNVEILARTGDALIAIDNKLRVRNGSGEAKVLIESRFDRAAIRVGGKVSIITAQDRDEVEILSGADETEITIGNDLKIRLGGERDLLKMTGVEVAGLGLLDGEESIDTFVDGGGNTFGTSIIDFEL